MGLMRAAASERHLEQKRSNVTYGVPYMQDMSLIKVYCELDMSRQEVNNFSRQISQRSGEDIALTLLQQVAERGALLNGRMTHYRPEIFIPNHDPCSTLSYLYFLQVDKLLFCWRFIYTSPHINFRFILDTPASSGFDPCATTTRVWGSNPGEAGVSHSNLK